MMLDVLCLCAEWCGTCRTYRPEFEKVIGAHNNWRAHWLDLEDHEAALDGIDITTFPMILIVDASGSLCFVGAVTPQPGTLQRLCNAAQDKTIQASATDVASWTPWIQQLGLRDEK